MHCTNCGQQIPGNSAYCVRCGSPVEPDQNTRRKTVLGAPLGPVQVPWRAGQVGIGIVIVAAAALLVSQVIILLGGGEKNPALVAFLTSLVLGVIILGAVYLSGLMPYKVGFSTLGLRPPRISNPRTWLLTIGALVLSLSFTAIYSLLVMASGIEILEPPDIPSALVFPGPAAVITFLALAMWTPITEEIFFRGFVFAGLTFRWGSARAMIISALIFSIFHIVPGVMIPIFVTGLLLAFLYRQTGSVWPGIVAHAGQNAIALLVTMVGF